MVHLLVIYGSNMLHTLLTYLAIIFYLVMAYCFFTEWLHFFLQDEEMNLEQRLFSSVILVTASILWIIVVPFAYLELLKFHKKHKGVIDLLINRSHVKIYED
jgi:tellurite resistance protein TehA-like permease